MKYVYLISLGFFFNHILAQQPQWQWAQRGGSDIQPTGFSGINQYADHIVTDTAGNSYVCGAVNSPDCTFSNFEGVRYATTFGMLDIFLAKYDCGGSLVWVNIIGTSGRDNPDGLQLGHDGTIYLYGVESNDTLFIGTPFGVSTVITGNNNGGLFLAKFNPSGALESTKFLNKSITFDSPFTQSPSCEFLEQRSNGNLIICGNTNGGILTDSINLPAGTFLAEVDTSLNVIWAKCIANTSIVDRILYFNRFVLDSNNNIFIAGDIDGGYSDSVILAGLILKLTPGASSTAVVIKFDSVGNYLWHLVGNSPHYDAALYPTVDASGNLIVFVTTQKGDTVLGFPFNYTGNSVYEPAFIKLNGSDGSLMYGKVSSNATELNFSADIDLKYGPDHNLYFVYQLDGNVIFDNISLTTTIGNAQPLIWEFKDEDTAFKATNNYALINGLAPANDDANYPTWLTYDQQGNWYICGTLAGSIYMPFDTISYANGGEQTDMFVAKYGLPCGDTNALIPPFAPDNLVATATGPHAITVLWQDGLPYVQRFRIYRSLDGISWAVIDSVPSGINNYVDINVQQNVIYWYKASAVNNAGESPFTNSDTAEIMALGIEDIAQSSMQMLVQPNPNRGSFILTIAGTDDVSEQLVICSTDGREVIAQTIQITAGNNWYPIHLQNASPGVYIITICNGPQASTRVKFVVD